MITRSRIAPTPSGFLHLGNAFNFLLTEEIVRKAGGILRLRIDDGDAGRVRNEYLDDIFESLHWLGIEWQEGPRNTAEQHRAFSQSLRADRYQELIDELAALGEVFACSCTRKQLEATGGIYTGTCLNKNLPLDMPGATLRLDTRQDSLIYFEDKIMGAVAADIHKMMPFFVVRRRDGIAAYQIASLADDVEYGMNTIVRGADLLHSTAAQIYLAKMLGLNYFQRSFYHHPLMTNEAGEKLSKSVGSYSLKQMRGNRQSTEQLRTEYLIWRAHFL